MRMPASISTVTVGLGVLACTAEGPEAEPAQDETARIDASAVTAEINEIREREFAAFSEGDVDELVALFSDDAVILPPGAPSVSGESAMREWAQGMADEFTISGEYTGSEVELVGEVAVEAYTGNLELTDANGESTSMPIQGIHVYRRQSDGSWLITHDVWNARALGSGDP